MEWYYILGIISYGIFIIQFILSNLGIVDVDIDIDCDGDVDFDVGDLVSFKGLIHFIMGFSGWLMLTGQVTIVTVSIAVLIGIIFVVALYYLYKLCMRFNYEPKPKIGKSLVGRKVVVYVPLTGNSCSCYLVDEPYTEIPCISDSPRKQGEVCEIIAFNSGIYTII